MYLELQRQLEEEKASAEAERTASEFRLATMAEETGKPTMDGAREDEGVTRASARMLEGCDVTSPPD